MLVKSDIISILNKVLGQQPYLRKGGTQAIYYCPVCNHHKRKLEICLLEGKNFSKWHCWTCNVGGYLGTLLRKVNAPVQYRKELYTLVGDIRFIMNQQINDSNLPLSLPSEFRPLSKVNPTPEYKNAIYYLKKRGILKEDILRYNIGYAEEGSYEYHIIIPSYDANGELNFFYGRRYYETPNALLHKKPNTSMNIVGFECFINYTEPIILVEGAFNAITLRRNAIPLFGKYMSKKLQEALIVNNVDKVYIFLDSDAKIDAINISKQLLHLGVTPYMVDITTDKKDPNEIGFNRSWELINNAQEVDFSYLLRHKLQI